jgi:hypothetical protein
MQNIKMNRKPEMRVRHVLKSTSGSHGWGGEGQIGWADWGRGGCG